MNKLTLPKVLRDFQFFLSIKSYVCILNACFCSYDIIKERIDFNGFSVVIFENLLIRGI